MVRTKVFVGNLSFNTKENELAKEFEVAGKVISANIITRGPRSLGYGFVEMDNETDAQNAVKLLDKKEIDGRPINVEVAKPREEGADLGQQANAQGSARGVNNNRGGPRRGNSSNRGNGRGGNNTGAPRSNQNQGQQQGQNQDSEGQQRQGQRRPPQSRRREYDDMTQNSSAQRTRPPRAPRTQRPEGELDTRTPSTTTLFVANLPFSIEDETFAKVLKDANLAHKTAHVVKKRTGRSKGFGFIEFDNEADQQKALASLNNKEVEGRALAVKVALTELRVTEDNQTSSSSSSAPAKSTSSPSPAKTSSPAPTKNTTTQSTPTKNPASNERKVDDKPSTPKQ